MSTMHYPLLAVVRDGRERVGEVEEKMQTNFHPREKFFYQTLGNVIT